VRRGGSGGDAQRIEAAVDRWSRFNDVLIGTARSTDDVHAIDATRPVDEVESDVRDWVLAKLTAAPWKCPLAPPALDRSRVRVCADLAAKPASERPME
jgi:hypothetical protein